MAKLLNQFVDICLLRAGPQALPASGLLLVLTGLAGLLSGTLVIISGFGGLMAAFSAQTLDLLLIATLLYVALAVRGLQPRFVQSATALFGCGVLINLAAMPVQLMLSQQEQASPVATLGLLFYLVLLIWAIVVIAHILRHALEVRFAAGMLLSLGYFLLVNWLVQSLFPAS